MTQLFVKTAGLALILSALSVPFITGAQAQNTAPPKTVRFIVGFGVGGGYDLYSRLYARHVGAYLPGRPAVIVQNMPGAGSIRAAQYLFFNAPKDGSVIGMMEQGLYLAQQTGETKINFDVRKFGWIGRLTNTTPVLFTWHTSPIKSTKDFFEKETIIYTAGFSPRLNYILLEKLTSARVKIIPNYEGNGAAMLAMQRGEIHGLGMPWPIVLTQHKSFVDEKKITPILQMGAEKDVELPDLPRMIDIAKNEHDRMLFEFIGQASRVGRSVFAPPDLSPETTAMLRKAFDETVRDAKFLGDAEREKLTLALMSGEELAAQVERDGQYPQDIVKEAAEAAQEAGHGGD